MFAFCASPPFGTDVHDLEAMGTALRGAVDKPALWCDDHGRAGFAAGTAGILPEDTFDRQPLLSPTLVFAARARIDNRDEILGKLDIPGERWPVLADSEVLFCAYRRWEQECVQHLCGDYAFAAWHRETGKVVAAVDHIGAARLYYSQTGGRLLLSTQLGALLAHPQASRDLDLKALGLLVAPKIEEGSTPFKDIRVLPGGHLMIHSDGTLNIRRWWQPDTAIRTRYRNPDDYVLAAREVLDQAVRARLRTTGGNVAVMMSGGLDSTLIAAAAASELKERGRDITAYLSVPEPGLTCDSGNGWEADDSPYATAVARMHDNLKLVKISPGGSCTLDVVPQIHAISRTPVRNGANHIWIARSCLAARATGARVVLQGGKGNATISQSGEGVLRDLMRQRKWRQAIRQASLCVGAGGSGVWRTIARDIAGERARELFNRLRGVPNGIFRPGEELLTSEFQVAHATALKTFARPASSRSGQVAFMTLPGNQWAADPMAQWGVEDRDPTGDRRLIELLLSFPVEAFSISGWPRGLARAMGRGRVPDLVRFRKTRGAQVPEIAGIIALHAAKYRQALEQAQDSPMSSAQFCSIFDTGRVLALLEQVCDGRNISGASTLARVADVSLFLAGAHP